MGKYRIKLADKDGFIYYNDLKEGTEKEIIEYAKKECKTNSNKILIYEIVESLISIIE